MRFFAESCLTFTGYRGRLAGHLRSEYAEEMKKEKSLNAHAGSRIQVTSMGGLYDAGALHAL